MGRLWHIMKIAAGMLGTRKTYTGPVWAQIGIVNPCNHRCIMCWDHPTYVSQESPYPTLISKKFYEAHPEIDRDRGVMGLEMLKDLVDDLYDLGTRRVELVGRGEPLMHPKFDLVVDILKSRGFYVGVVTNGSLLTRDRCEYMVRSGVDRMVISLDAGTRDTYPLIHTRATSEDYDLLLQHLLFLREVKASSGRKVPQVMLSFVISRPNYHEAIEMIDRGNEVGANQLVFKYAIPYSNTEFIELKADEKFHFSRQLSTFFERAKSFGIDLKIEPPIGDLTSDPGLHHKKTETVYSKIPCYIGWCFALITAEGSVSPCCQCMEQMGHLASKRFREIWTSEPYNQFREKMKRFPEGYGDPTNCMCSQCAFEKINTTIYNLLHFYAPVHLHDAQREFNVRDLFLALFGGKPIRGTRTVRRPPGSSSDVKPRMF